MASKFSCGNPRPFAHSRPNSTYRMASVGSQPSGKGPEDWFTGSVRIDPLFQPNEHRRAAAAVVTFEPGSRTAWHTHPLGQTLIVTSGIGLVQREGGSVEEIHPGDVVWFAPNEKHWHGASPTGSNVSYSYSRTTKGNDLSKMLKIKSIQNLR